ncbi:PHAX family protein [Megaselia abdita]
MDLETQTFDNLEDGEIEDDSDGYIPLQRPASQQQQATREQKEANIPIVDDFSAEDESISSGESDSDDCFNNKRQKTKRTVLVRSPPTNSSNQKFKFKKYQVWATTLEEDSLTEDMRGIGVAHSMNDRSVETYDFNLKYRLDGSNRRKRQVSDNDTLEDSDGPSNKRCKSSYASRPKKRSVKDRLGPKKNSSESSDLECEPRILANLTKREDDDADSVAKEIAFNLFEEKDDLILRLVSVVGTRKAIELFKETQRIEKDGGMMIVNGKRRRTPGGVYFFLLKHDNLVTSAQRKIIFYEENKVATKDRKSLQAIKRDQKVEELKKRLTEQDHLPLPIISSASSNENSVNLITAKFSGDVYTLLMMVEDMGKYGQVL